jgi:hypothetical protein
MNFNIDVVRQWAEEVWTDLRESRLAGVAIGLGLLLLVITASAIRSGGPLDIEPAAGGPAPTATPQDTSFQFPGEAPMSIRDIEASNERNPFQSIESLNASTGSGGSNGGGSDESASETVTALSNVATGTSTPTELQPLGDVPTASPSYPADSDSGSDLDSGSDSTPAGTIDDDKEPTSAPATDYSYTADVQFGQVDDLRRYATVQRLGLIPSRKMPLIMYLGVSTDHETAVFMVDSRLSQGGEGTCVPKDTLCTFLELKPTPSQDEHHFMDADGNEYLLRLRALNRTTDSSGTLSGRSVSALQGSPAVIDGER